MPGIRRIEAAERRRRLSVRHALSPATRAAGVLAAARRVVALHATDPASVFLGLRARTGLLPAHIEEALYVRRSVVRMLGMRRTMFVVPVESMPLVGSSTMPRIVAAQRKLLVKHLSQVDSIDDPDGFLSDVQDSVLQVLEQLGGRANAAELAEAEPRLRTAILMAEGKRYEARPAITSRVLLLLGAEGRIVRGRPSGSWLSQRYEWALTGSWLPTVADELEPARARAELARQWLAAYGPALLADLQWWTGWTMAQVRQAAKDLGVSTVELASGTGVALPDDLDDTAETEPWAALLPALDSTTMGWWERSWFLGDHQPYLFDRAGNAGPTVWFGGRVVGGWAQRPDGEIAIRMLEDIGSEGAKLVQQEAERTAAWLGDIRFTPRFRTPTERELSG